MIDRTRFPAQGFAGGQPGAPGAFRADGEPKAPKTVVYFKPGSRVELSPPGGGGYGDPLERQPERVLHDVVEGFGHRRRGWRHSRVDKVQVPGFTAT